MANTPKPTRPDQLTRLLKRKPRASIAQMEEPFGWQPHTAHAAVSRLRKAGVSIERSLSNKRSVYRISEGNVVSSDAS